MNTKTKGYLLGIIAASSYGMNPLFALPLYQAGMDPDSVLFFRYLFAIPVLGIMLKARGRDFRLRRREIVPLIVMGLLVAISSLTLFLSYNYMDAGIASTILFVYPIMVALIMWAVFKEKLALMTGFCILLALAGIGLLYKGSDGTTLSLPGTLLALGSALSYAIYIVGVNPRRRSPDTRRVVPLDQPPRLGHFPDRHFLPLHDQRDPIHRLDAHGDPRRAGTRDGDLFRRHDLWRNT